MKKSVSAILIVILTIASFGLIAGTTKAGETQTQRSWVQVNGRINQYGSTPAFGWLEAHVMVRSVNQTTVFEKAEAHAMWFPGLGYNITPEGMWNITRPSCNETRPGPCNETRPVANFTFSFYAVRLINSSVITLNTSAVAPNNLYISGLWDVLNVTFVHYLNRLGVFDGDDYNETIRPVVFNATGELRVFSDWTKFELSIKGLELVSGSVQHYFVGIWEIMIGDVDGDGKVDIKDLVHIAHAYGTKPGIGRYGFDVDLNFDFQVDIGDLTTAAAQINP